jgi:hypothetical protein
MKNTRFILLALACTLSMAASAQWQWTDKDGRRVFSDRAPPADIQEKNILKRPGGRVAPATASEPSIAAASTSPASASVAAASAPKLTGTDRELAEKKKKTEEAEVAKRKAEEEKIVKTKVENCARAKQAKAGFDSGIRIARTNDKGEREVMDEAARAGEMKRIQTVIDADCK